MKDIIQHFERIQSLIIGLYNAEVERYEEQVLLKDKGNLRVRLRFIDNSLLEISEAISLNPINRIEIRLRTFSRKAAFPESN